MKNMCKGKFFGRKTFGPLLIYWTRSGVRGWGVVYYGNATYVHLGGLHLDIRLKKNG